jgi:transcriptional regulator with XRE-family HTH domain
MEDLNLKNRLLMQKSLEVGKNLSLKEVALAVGIPTPTLHHFLSGNIPIRDAKKVEKIAKFFKLTSKELLKQLADERGAYAKQLGVN